MTIFGDTESKEKRHKFCMRLVSDPWKRFAPTILHIAPEVAFFGAMWRIVGENSRSREAPSQWTDEALEAETFSDDFVGESRWKVI